MDLKDAFDGLHRGDLWFVLIGLAVLAATILPRLLANYPLSVPLVLVGLGMLTAPLGLKATDPLEQGLLVEKLTELTVIISLMGAGLKIDRPIGWKRWNSTWRLLSITMIIGIALVAFLGWWIAALVPATAILLGACIAPTDPVLASDVQVGPPGQMKEEEQIEEHDRSGKGREDEVRFALTSEAGLNDGLAFPFTNMAIAMVVFGAAAENWFVNWLIVDVIYQIVIGVVVGMLIGKLFARSILSIEATTDLAKAVLGLASLAATLLIYGAAEYAGAYGFIAVFVGALTIRDHERNHNYHKSLHQFSEMAERLMSALVLIGFGAAIVTGMFDPLTWELVLLAVLIVLVVRPIAGAIAMIGFTRIPWRERWAISLLGVRGIGSFYYLAYALNMGYFEEAEELWAVVGLVVLISIIVHGAVATSITKHLDLLRVRDRRECSDAGICLRDRNEKGGPFT